jgi:MFS family permease
MSRPATGYRSLLRTPGAAAFFFAAAVGRVGTAMTGLGLLWLLHARTGSYGTAGLAVAGFAVAEALIGPQLARLIDRFGQTRVLPCCLLAHGVAIAAVLASSTPGTQIAAATCAGAVVPQLGALSSARWAYLLRGERAGELTTAFSLESLANATAYLLGPVLVTSLGAAGETVLASAIAAGLILGGGTALAAQRRTAPQPARERARQASARQASTRQASTRQASTRTKNTLRQPAFLLLALLNLAIGLYFGTMQVSVSAYAVGHGMPGAAALIIAAASFAGLLGGWVYGLRRPHAPARRQLVMAAAYLTGTALLLPFAPSAIWLGAAVALTEAAVPPTLVLLNVLTEQAVHPNALTEAFTWNNSASAAGSALAATFAGHAADAWGASAALGQAPAAGLILLILAIVLTRQTDHAPCSMSQLCMSAMCFSRSACPSSSKNQASTPGMCAASHRPWLTGTAVSWPPCSNSTGTDIWLTSKPHGVSCVTQSSQAPSIPGAMASCIETASSVSSSRSTPGVRQALSAASWAGDAASISTRSFSNDSREAAGSASISRTSSTAPAPKPVSQSSPSASYGASDARDAAAVTRSGSRAAQASTCGPPPDEPSIASFSIPSAAQITRTSAAQSAVTRPG